MRTRIVTGLATAIVSCLLLRFLRSYPWELALISGVLLGGLIFVTLQTLTRLRRTLSQFGTQPRSDDEPPSDGAD